MAKRPNYTPEQRKKLEDFGKRLRQLRLQADWTQEEMAKRFGMSVTHYSQAEQGNANLTVLKMFDGLNLLKVELRKD